MHCAASAGRKADDDPACAERHNQSSSAGRTITQKTASIVLHVGRALLQRAPRCCAELANKNLLGELASDGQVALALECRDSALGIWVERSA
jgi:hypothetical protein